MSITKPTAVAAQASASNAAGATATGAWVDLTDSYESSVLARITNGGTGPTAACTVRVDLSPDNGTTIYPGAGGSYSAMLAASTVYAASFPLGGDARYARTVFSGNTGQAVTVQADITKVTAL